MIVLYFARRFSRGWWISAERAVSRDMFCYNTLARPNELTHALLRLRTRFSAARPRYTQITFWKCWISNGHCFY